MKPRKPKEADPDVKRRGGFLVTTEKPRAINVYEQALLLIVLCQCVRLLLVCVCVYRRGTLTVIKQPGEHQRHVIRSKTTSPTGNIFLSLPFLLSLSHFEAFLHSKAVDFSFDSVIFRSKNFDCSWRSNENLKIWHLFEASASWTSNAKTWNYRLPTEGTQTHRFVTATIVVRLFFGHPLASR